MLEKCASFLKNECSIPNNARILLAVSGGVDSMVMLDIMKGLPYDIGVAHCNFHLRDQAADEDEIFVRQTASNLSLPYFCAHFDTRKHAKENKLSIEMAARELRYRWFGQIAGSHGYSHIATAHHQDDAMETFFLNLCRGTGIRGLTGIRACTGNIIRPLICFSREEIRQYATDHHIAYHEDATNREDTYRRNYIRHHIIPAFRQLYPSFDRNMAKSMRILQAQEEVYRHHTDEIGSQLMQKDEAGFRIDRSALQNLPFPDIYLFEMLHPYGFNMTQVQAVLQNPSGRKGRHYRSKSHQLWLKEGELLLRPTEEEPQFPELVIDMVRKEQFKGYETDGKSAYFDANSLAPGLHLRFWQHGDSFVPLGMQGRKKLSDFFNDLKIDGYQKSRIPLLCDGNGEIAWVVGYRSDQRFRVREETRNILIVKIQETPIDN